MLCAQNLCPFHLQTSEHPGEKKKKTKISTDSKLRTVGTVWKEWENRKLAIGPIQKKIHQAKPKRE